jgi:ABC-2 type transport system ATP-binding protein
LDVNTLLSKRSKPAHERSTKPMSGRLEIAPTVPDLAAGPEHRRRADIADPAIRARGLTKVYDGEITAVDRLNLDVDRGELFGLLGPNGAGKTTTVGMFTTRIRPTRGSAAVAGIDVMSDPVRARRALGVVSQVNTLDRSLSVAENLYYHGRYFGMSAQQARAATDHLLHRFRLADRSDAEVNNLSGGMARRLMIARAVLHRPAVLFLDEPTAGLDPQSRLALWDLLLELHEDGTTVVLTTHAMEEAERLCDRVAIIDHGRLLALDTPDALKQSLGGEAEARVAVRGDAGEFAAALADRLGPLGAGPARIIGDTVRVATQGAIDQILPAILTTATERGVAVTDFSVAEPTLETVFLNLTGRELRE